MTIASRLEALERSRPEWGPWLAAIRVIIDEIASGQWSAAAVKELDRSPAIPGDSTAPLIASSPAAPDPDMLARLLARLMHAGVEAGVLGGRRSSGGDVSDALAAAAFRAALRAQEPALESLAAGIDVDPARFRSIAMLLPMPWLHACRQALQRELSRTRCGGYCPCCGAWPALAYVCGIERSRYLHCGRCGTAWPTATLLCPYCGTNDHRELGSLRIDHAGETAVIDVCGRCRGYLKSLQKLRLGAGEDVLLDDLESVELDIVAAARAYRRPPGLGHPLIG
jgi:FdhE protein